MDSTTPREPARIAAIVLAAGLSSRFGGFKPLAMLKGHSFLDHVLENLATAGPFDPIVVVTGHRASEVIAALQRHTYIVAHNIDFAEGEMLSSLKTALRSLSTKVDAAILCLVDQPMVKRETIAALIETWQAKRPRILQPSYGNKRGHPIVLSAVGFAEILALPANATLKDYTSRYAAEALEVPVDDPAVVRDIDTPADLAAEEGTEDSCTPRT